MERLAFVLALLLASAVARAQPGVRVDTGGELFQQAAAAENGGKVQEAMRLYVKAAQAGNAKAALRLAEIYDKGAPGVARDYAQSLKWHNAARVLGGER